MNATSTILLNIGTGLALPFAGVVVLTIILVFVYIFSRPRTSHSD